MVPCESSNAFFKSLIPAARWCDATRAALRVARRENGGRKSPACRVAHRVAGFGLERFHDAVAPGVTEAELAASSMKRA